MPRPVIHVWLVFAQSIISTRFAPSCGAILCSGHARTPPQKNGRAEPVHPPLRGGGPRRVGQLHNLEQNATQLGAKRGAKWRYGGHIYENMSLLEFGASAGHVCMVGIHPIYHLYEICSKLWSRFV